MICTRLTWHRAVGGSWVCYGRAVQQPRAWPWPRDTQTVFMVDPVGGCPRRYLFRQRLASNACATAAFGWIAERLALPMDQRPLRAANLQVAGWAW